jgi:hypothetical protein
MQFALRTALAFVSSDIERTLFRLALGARGGETAWWLDRSSTARPDSYSGLALLGVVALGSCTFA